MASRARPVLHLPHLPLLPPLLLLAWCALATCAAVGEKPGSCPPPTGWQVCVNKCYADGDCPWAQKCCGTLCGGSMCINAVSAPLPRLQPSAAEGECPAVAGTPWVCRSRCSSDGECRRGQRCCQHRCGGYSCLPTVRRVARGDADDDADDR